MDEESWFEYENQTGVTRRYESSVRGLPVLLSALGFVKASPSLLLLDWSDDLNDEAER